MQINDKTMEITTSQYDWGVPVVFEAGTAQGFNINDKIIFTFNNDNIADRVYTVNIAQYTFNLALTKQEADSLFSSKIGAYLPIKYSVKRYVANQFLETIVDSTLKVVGTLKWEGEDG